MSKRVLSDMERSDSTCGGSKRVIAEGGPGLLTLLQSQECSSSVVSYNKRIADKRRKEREMKKRKRARRKANKRKRQRDALRFKTPVTRKNPKCGSTGTRIHSEYSNSLKTYSSKSDIMNRRAKVGMASVSAERFPVSPPTIERSGKPSSGGMASVSAKRFPVSPPTIERSGKPSSSGLTNASSTLKVDEKHGPYNALHRIADKYSEAWADLGTQQAMTFESSSQMHEISQLYNPELEKKEAKEKESHRLTQFIELAKNVRFDQHKLDLAIAATKLPYMAMTGQKNLVASWFDATFDEYCVQSVDFRNARKAKLNALVGYLLRRGILKQVKQSDGRLLVTTGDNVEEYGRTFLGQTLRRIDVFDKRYNSCLQFSISKSSYPPNVVELVKRTLTVKKSAKKMASILRMSERSFKYRLCDILNIDDCVWLRMIYADDVEAKDDILSVAQPLIDRELISKDCDVMDVINKLEIVERSELVHDIRQEFYIFMYQSLVDNILTQSEISDARFVFELKRYMGGKRESEA